MRSPAARRPVAPALPAAGYLALQGLAVAVWWLLIALLPAVRAAFRPAPEPQVLDAYLLPDLVLLAAGSLLAGWLVLRASAWAAPTTAVVLGSMAYATLHLTAWSARSGHGWPGVALMGLAVLATLVALVAVLRR